MSIALHSGPRRARAPQRRDLRSLAHTAGAAVALRTALRVAQPAALLALLALLATAAPAFAQDANLARSLAATCANCHGTNGNARGDIKPLAGMPAESMVAVLNSFRSGTLPATIMHQIAKGYTDEQLRLIAGYFAAQKPAAK